MQKKVLWLDETNVELLNALVYQFFLLELSTPLQDSRSMNTWFHKKVHFDFCWRMTNHFSNILPPHHVCTLVSSASIKTLTLRLKLEIPVISQFTKSN